jgi:phenylacetate-coenzyme A ligase PaaK-like adenylate-forming protein
MLVPYQIPPWRLQNWWNMPRDEYRAYQGRVLSRFIGEQIYPYSAYYRRVFDENGIAAEDIRSLDDLSKIPLTSKLDLMTSPEHPDRPREFVLTPPKLRDYLDMDPDDRAAFFHGMTPAEKTELDRFLWEYLPVHANHTSGRSAAPTPVWFTRRDLYDYAENMARGGLFTKEDPLGVNLVLWPFTPVAHQAFWCMPVMALNIGAQAIHTGGGRAAGTETILQLARLHKPQTLCIMPGYAFHFVRRATEEGVRFPNLRVVSIGGEKCTDEMRRKLHEAFVSLGAEPEKLKVLVGYGATEFRGGASECPAPPGDFSSTWYHTKPDQEIFEIVDPDTGEVLPEGETGEVVYSCLDWRGSALLRYRTADLAVGGITTEPCPHCGATVPRISNELQRVSNLKDLQLTKLKGNLVDLGAFSPILSGIEEIDEFQVELRKRGDDPLDVDQVVVHVAIKQGRSDDVVAERVRKALRTGVDLEPNEVVFHPLDELVDRLGLETALKAERLVDNRPKESTI